MNDLIHRLSTLNILKQNGKFNSHAQKILDKHPTMMDDVLECTNFLNDDAPLRERLTCIRDGITQQPTCKYCDNHVKFNQARAEYGTYCGAKCSRRDPIVKQKVKNTFIEKYGVDNCAKHPVVKAKREKTNRDKYGVDYPLQNDDIRQRTHDTMQQKHGGVGFSSDIIQKKAKQSVLDIYGTNCVANLPHHKEKQKQRLLDQYGVYNSRQVHIDPRYIELLDSPDWLIEQHHVKKHTLTDIARKFNIDTTTVGNYYRKHSIEIKWFGQSQAERDIGLYLQQNGINIQTNKRDIINGELDIYIPSHKLAIEYNGLFWHSEQQGRPKNYHINKTLQCQQHNIQLLHIFEDEWNNNPDLVCSRLMSKLSLTENRYFARKCKIVEVDSTHARRFFHQNHIQGYVSASHTLGLTYNSVLVACMSFCQSRYDKRYQYELLRYATTQYSTVVGGPQRLLKHFETVYCPSSIITYSDKRWNTGDMYGRLGFTNSHSSDPNYFYVIDGKRQSRVKYQKHKLQHLLPIFDPDLTEYQNMLNNGHDRIWDCGNDVFVKLY